MGREKHWREATRQLPPRTFLNKAQQIMTDKCPSGAGWINMRKIFKRFLCFGKDFFITEITYHPPHMCLIFIFYFSRVFPDGSVVKNPPAKARDAGLIPGSGRRPGEGNGNALQYSCLENFMDRGGWWATVHGVAERVEREHEHYFSRSLTVTGSSPPY